MSTTANTENPSGTATEVDAPLKPVVDNTIVVPPIEGASPLTKNNLNDLSALPRADIQTKRSEKPLVVSDSKPVSVPPEAASVDATKNPQTTPLVGGKSPPPNPIAQGILNIIFACFLYWVSTKILVFYGISNDIYLVYFMFYLFLYVTTLLLPSDYERFD
jgi:hypothetical protein